MSHWLYSNKLTLNIEKSNFCVFYHKRTRHFNFNIKFGDLLLLEKTNVKYLGLIIDNKLSWNCHISSVLGKISKYVGIFYKLSNYIPSSVLLLLYNSLVYPHLTYALEIWGNATKTLLNPILLIQKKFARIISQASYLSHSAPLFYSLNMLDIYKLYSMHLQLLAFNITKTHNSTAFSLSLHPISSVHQYNTRSSSNQNLYFSSFNKSFCTRVSIAWNELPSQLKTLPYRKMYVVKKVLKNTLLSQYAV